MTTPPTTDQAVVDGRPRRSPRRLHNWLLPIQPMAPVNPALLKHAELRAQYAQNRVADRITAFSGSMAFVYLHIIWFASWIGFGVESYPYGLLTMIVSLEAIFLSTFVMISQNRAETKRQVIADAEWRTVQEEDRQNKRLLKLSNEQEHQNQELIDLSRQILTLTKQVRELAGKSEEDDRQNRELLDLSKRTFALTQDLHRSAR